MKDNHLANNTKIIAEIGANHDGDMSLAKEMICAAAENGANYAKFQSWREQDLKCGPWDEDKPFFHYKNKRDFYKKSELLDEQHLELINFCEKKDISFLTTCFSRSRIDFLSKLKMNSIKIAGTDSTSELMIKELSDKFNRLIVSTGMTTNKEITTLSKQLHELENDFVLMHCVSIYPTPIEKVSLSRMDFIKNLTKQRIDQGTMQPVPAHRGEFGISDHSLGINVPIAAVTRGATWIEKHFTIDNDLPGPDNKMSMLPKDLKKIREFCDDFALMQSSNSDEIQKDESELRDLLVGRFGNNQ